MVKKIIKKQKKLTQKQKQKQSINITINSNNKRIGATQPRKPKPPPYYPPPSNTTIIGGTGRGSEMMNQSSSSNDIANVLKAMVKGNMDFSGVGNLYSRLTELENRESAMESRVTKKNNIPNDTSDSMRRVHFNEEDNMSDITKISDRFFTDENDKSISSMRTELDNSDLQTIQQPTTLKDFKFPDFKPQINVLQEQVSKKEQQQKIIEMQEMSEEEQQRNKELKEAQQQRNKELKEAQEKELEQLRKDKNTRYDSIKSNSSVLERKNITGDDVVKIYSEVIEKLNRVNNNDKVEMAKIRKKANIVMQTIGYRHFVSETKSTMLTKLTNPSTKEKIEELRKQQGTQVEMKGTPGPIPLSERTKTIAQLQSEGSQIIESTTNENAAEKKPKKEKVSKK